MAPCRKMYGFEKKYIQLYNLGGFGAALPAGHCFCPGKGRNHRSIRDVFRRCCGRCMRLSFICRGGFYGAAHDLHGDRKAYPGHKKA